MATAGVQRIKSGRFAGPRLPFWRTSVAPWAAGVYNGRMSDYAAESSPTELRFRADACRALAETSDNPERKALWLVRARQWEELALKAAERLLESVRSAHKA